MSELQQSIKKDMIKAMKAGEKERLSIIRLMMSAFKQIEVDERIELDDDRIIQTIDKMCKQRKESITQFAKAGRDDLIKIEENELTILNEYLPAALSQEEIDTFIDDAINKSGASSIKEMGKVMGILKPQLQGRADMGSVSQQIKTRLSA
ncbi:MAG: GatB/YqeY domain-containing protein [Gammaproteobacteria bacterium]|nr:GatB/YqeY domain-containing protein [Gammaproteobacteria bacterium]